MGAGSGWRRLRARLTGPAAMLVSPVVAMTGGAVAVEAAGWAAVAAVTAVTVLSVAQGLATWRDTASRFKSIAVAVILGSAAVTPWAVATQRWLQIPADGPCAGCISQTGSMPAVGGLSGRVEMISAGPKAQLVSGVLSGGRPSPDRPAPRRPLSG
jgi:hypothetical protein